MSRLDIERFGGFASYGSPGSHLRSRGQVDSADLSPADQKQLEQLFAHPPSSGHTPDAFQYRLTRHGSSGPQTIEVAEQHVPMAIRNAVKDELL